MKSNEYRYVRNRISEVNRADVIELCLRILRENRHVNVFPRWEYMHFIQLSLLNGGNKLSKKRITKEKLRQWSRLLIEGSSTEQHIINYFKSGEVYKAFKIIGHQQFYLQQNASEVSFGINWILVGKLKARYDLKESFFNHFQISVAEYLKLLQVLWIISHLKLEAKLELKFNGYISSEHIEYFKAFAAEETVTRFLDMLSISDISDPIELKDLKGQFKNPVFKPLEVQPFIYYPLIQFKGLHWLVDNSVLENVINFHIYELLRMKDKNLSEELGLRIEKFVELGLQELGLSYIKESELEGKFKLEKHSNKVDFVLDKDNILIECKLAEQQAITSVYPEDHVIYKGLKHSVFKAYFHQFASMSAYLENSKPKYGIILVYKEFFGNFEELYPIGVKFEKEIPADNIAAENVFIVDLKAWVLLLEVMKHKKATLNEILSEIQARKIVDRKATFHMYLDEFVNIEITQSYILSGIKEVSIVQDGS